MSAEFEWHGDEVMRRINNSTGSVNLPDLMLAAFMCAHTRFASLAEMVNASKLVPDGCTTEQLAAALQGKEWDQFVSQNSDFASWQEMMQAAATERVKRALEG